MSGVLCRQFSLEEIKDATNNFEKVLGHGGEGIVYLGQISALGRVAVKRLKSNLAEFEEEIEIVSKVKHAHLVSLHGYCEESGQKILVYEYMGNGSLSDYISKKSRSTISLSWQQRLNICLGAARGLQHLHTETEELPKGIIHRDIKPDNILLDEDWVAKVSDFGMCKLSHASQKQSNMITRLKGTGGYYAPEYVKYQRITRKIDVYAFGVVLFEALCRKMPWDRGDESYYGFEDEDLGLWARKNVDQEINGGISEDCLESFTHLIGRSLQQDPSRRPPMDDVVMDLESALKCQERQDEEMRPKSTTSGHSTRSGVLEDYSVESMQTIQKHLIKVRKLEMSWSTSSSARPSTSSRSSARASRYFDLDEIRMATNNFDSARIILGGEFGSTYKGLLDDGRMVAVKRYHPDGNFTDKFQNEIKILSKYHNEHLVSIIGKCEDDQELILVHEFMKNGNLAYHLFQKEATISWDQRLMICIDAAKGLQYLHHGTSNTKTIIHRNVTPAIILLDENWSAKISEFGYAKMGAANTKNSAVKTDVQGTYKYLDPYYNLTGQLTRRTDIYAFGVVLFDVLFGREDFNGGLEHKQEKLGQWAEQCLSDGSLDQIIDERLKGHISSECLKEFAELASRCLLDNPMKRPTIDEVVEKLEYTLKISQQTRP